MKKEQRICVLLAIMILGILGLEAKSSGSLIPKSWKIRMIQSVQENAGAALYSRELHIRNKKTRGNPGDGGCCPHGICSGFLLGNYVTEREAAELLTEDEATYCDSCKKAGRRREFGG